MQVSKNWVTVSHSDVHNMGNAIFLKFWNNLEFIGHYNCTHCHMQYVSHALMQSKLFARPSDFLIQCNATSLHSESQCMKRTVPLFCLACVCHNSIQKTLIKLPKSVLYICTSLHHPQQQTHFFFTVQQDIIHIILISLKHYCLHTCVCVFPSIVHSSMLQLITHLRTAW